jgi:hypothetical protein
VANSEIIPEFRVVGPEYEGALDVLVKSFPLRMVNIVIQENVIKHGADNALIPTDVHFMPVFNDGDRFFAVRAWHETQASAGRVGVLQPYLGNFDLILGPVDGYLHHRPEDESQEGIHYKLTTAEFAGLISLSNLAVEHDAVAALVSQETS